MCGLPVKSRDYECTYELCKCWFTVYDIWSAESLKCPLCQREVKQL